MKSNASKDTVIFTNGNLFSRIILDKFLTKYKTRISIVVIVTGDYYGNKGLGALFNYIKYTSWIYVLYKILTILIIKVLNIGNKTIISSVSQLCIANDVPYCFTGDINDLLLFEQIKNSFPEYIVSVSCPQLIRKKWLQLVDEKGINIHSSKLPCYAGIAPYFWVLANDEAETGISVHYLTKSFDKGNILSQNKISIEKGVSVFNLFLQLCQAGQNILPEAFDKMIEKQNGTIQDYTPSSYYSHPTTKAYLKLRKNGFFLFCFPDFGRVKKYLMELTE